MPFYKLNIAFLLCFLLSAAVQYNDPDALPWIALYLAAAAMCLENHLRRKSLAFPILLTAVSMAGGFYLASKVAGRVSPGEVFASINMQSKGVEEAREIGGLQIVLLWSVFSIFFRSRSTP